MKEATYSLSETESQPQSPNGLKWFFIWVVALFLLRCSLIFIRLPMPQTNAFSALDFANLVVTIAVMSLSLLAIYCGAKHKWQTKLAWIFLVVGVIVHIGGALLTRAMPQSILLEVVAAVAQSGILVWCLGLGALLSILIKEKNLLLPVAIFLAGFDAYIILRPRTPQSQIIAQNPEFVGTIGMSMPAVSTTSQPVGAPIQDLAFVGPADLFFVATFFCLLIRHNMKVKTTVAVLIPVLLLYLMLVFMTGIPLPALVPIGAVILIVNWKEFQMTAQEKMMTLGVTVLSLGLAGYALYKRITFEPESLTESSTTVGVPGPPGQEDSPVTEPGD